MTKKSLIYSSAVALMMSGLMVGCAEAEAVPVQTMEEAKR